MAIGAPRPERPAVELKFRRSAENLVDDQIEVLRKAVRAVMDNTRDERGYWHHAGIHGLPLPAYCQVAHGTPFFLPWHRAYLYEFEKALQDADDERRVTLPWWDWTTDASQRGELPRAFSEKTWKRRPNPLYSAEIDPVALEEWEQVEDPDKVDYASRTERHLGTAGWLPTTDQIEEVMLLRDFTSFWQELDRHHGAVHMWVGGRQGHMGDIPFSAYDPIFWAHHTMIDRLWRIWQEDNGNSTVPQALLDRPLRPFELTVADTLEVTTLGYDYASATTRVHMEV